MAELLTVTTEGDNRANYILHGETEPNQVGVKFKYTISIEVLKDGDVFISDPDDDHSIFIYREDLDDFISILHACQAISRGEV